MRRQSTLAADDVGARVPPFDDGAFEREVRRREIGSRTLRKPREKREGRSVGDQRIEISRGHTRIKVGSPKEALRQAHELVEGNRRRTGLPVECAKTPRGSEQNGHKKKGAPAETRHWSCE